MNNLKENKKFLFAPIAVALFFFFRSILFAERSYIGVQNLFTMELAFSGENIALIVLFAVFAVLAGLTISKVSRKFGEAVTFLLVLIVAEPFFFAKQMNCVVMFIAVLALLFILNALGEKRIIPDEVTLIIFLLVSCVLEENAVFLFVIPAVILYFAGDGEGFIKSTKKIIMMIFSFISVGIGMLTNNYIIEKYPAFEKFIKTYSFFEQIYFRHIDYENILLFVFVIPATVLGCYFFVEFIKNCDKKRNKAAFSVAIVLASAAYILSIIGFILKGSSAFFTINYIVPLSIFALLAKGNKEAEKALKTVNDFLSKYRLAFVVTTVFLSYVATLVFYKDTDNLVGFIMYL